MAKIVENVMHIPLNDNDGKSLRSLIEAFERVVLGAYGGFTSHNASGAWMSPEGKVYAEPMLRYVVAFDVEDKKLADFWLDIARLSAKVMRQECIYVTLDGAVHFAAPSDLGVMH